MPLTRKLGIIALLVYTFLITVLRAFRSPNDFAEAHWLLDYRFGFVKRGLIGEIVSIVTGFLSIPVTAELIAALSTIVFLIFCATIIVVVFRIVQRTKWSIGAVLVLLVFLSSPFIVLSTHFIGYYDNIVMVLGIAALFLLLRGQSWLGACLLVPAFLIHENSIVLAFALFVLAWVLLNSRNHQIGSPSLPFLPLLLPICAFLAVAIGQELFVASNFKEVARAYLSQFPFIQEERDMLVPQSLSTSFLFYYSLYSSEFPLKVFAIDMHGLVLPSVFAILSFVVNAFRIRVLSIESLLLLGVCFAPQLMQLVATDTPRIWSYTIFCVFIALWLYLEIFPAQEETQATRLLSLIVLITNALILTPLMDYQNDHFSLTTRLLLYAPVLLGSLALIVYEENTPLSARLSIQGSGIAALFSAKQQRTTLGASTQAESKAPEA